MISLSDDKQADVIDAFNTTSRYLDDILNINNVYFDNMVSQICSSEFQLNKANTSDTEASFLDLHLSISNDIISTKIYDKSDVFDFDFFLSISHFWMVMFWALHPIESIYLNSFFLLDLLAVLLLFVCLFCCLTSQVNSYGHGRTVSSPNHPFLGKFEQAVNQFFVHILSLVTDINHS